MEQNIRQGQEDLGRKVGWDEHSDVPPQTAEDGEPAPRWFGPTFHQNRHLDRPSRNALSWVRLPSAIAMMRESLTVHGALCEGIGKAGLEGG